MTHEAWQQEEMIIIAMLQSNVEQSVLQASRSGFATPINSIPEAFDLSGMVYPNPVSDDLYFKASLQNDFTRATLYSISGEKILEADLLNRVDLRTLHPGTYILVLSDKQGKAVGTKLVKNNR